MTPGDKAGSRPAPKKTTAKKEPVKEEPSQEDVKESDEEALQKQYMDETGKNAIWRGKQTKGYIEWKAEKQK